MSVPDGHVPAPCISDAKIGGDLLDVNHVEGGPKAKFFLARGFSVESPSSFIMALLEHGRPEYFVKAEQDNYVTNYIHEGPMPMPDGSNPKTRSVWRLIQNDLFMSLVTAYAY